MKKMLHITGHQGNANQNHTEIQRHAHQDGQNHSDNHRCWQEMWRRWNTQTLLLGMWWCCHFAKRFLKKVNMELPYDPPVPLLGIYPRELKKNMSTQKHAQESSQQQMAKKWKGGSTDCAWIKCSPSVQWVIIQPWRARKFWHTLQRSWLWLIWC